MAKVENSAAPSPLPSLDGASLPKLGAFAILGATLMVPACASTRPPTGFAQPVGPVLTPAEVVERQANQRGRDEFTHAQNVARQLGIGNFVYVASNGRDYSAFSKADSLQGNTGDFPKSTISLRENGNRIEFTLEAFERWKARQVTAVRQGNIGGAIIDLDGRVWAPSNPARPVAHVEPFLVLRDQK